MPKQVSEISSGAQFSRSSNEGQLADSQTRTYRILKESVGEIVDIQEACGVRIGDQHPFNTNLYCVSFDARFDGDSRLVIAATFNYQTTADSQGGGQDPKSQPPDVRPANWTTSTSLMEVPVSVWSKRAVANPGAWDAPEPAVNPAGDMYDGVTALAPVVTISITQFEPRDPITHLKYAGYVNSEPIVLGSLTMIAGTVMFRGLSHQPVVESWGDRIYRGWTATYEFAYRRNTTKVRIGGADVEADIGWDIAVPVTGFNVRAFAPNGAAGDEDIYGQPLRHNQGKIVPPLLLPEGVDVGDRVRAMVKVFEYEDGGTSQLPSASPVPLKLNGRPLKTHNANGDLINPPLVFAYQTQKRVDFNQFGLRLQ